MILREGNSRYGIQVNRRRQHTASLVIRMVSSDLCSAGCGEQGDLIVGRKCLLVEIQKRSVTSGVLLRLLRVQMTDLLLNFSRFHPFLPFLQFHNAASDLIFCDYE